MVIQPFLCCFRNSVADPDPGSGAFFLSPGYRSGMHNPDHISVSLETIFLLKYLNSLMRIRDPGWKIFGSVTLLRNCWRKLLPLMVKLFIAVCWVCLTQSRELGRVEMATFLPTFSHVGIFGPACWGWGYMPPPLSLYLPPPLKLRRPLNPLLSKTSEM